MLSLMVWLLLPGAWLHSCLIVIQCILHSEYGCWCKVGEHPTAFLMDSPGVMLPNVPDERTGMRLALTGDEATALQQQPYS